MTTQPIALSKSLTVVLQRIPLLSLFLPVLLAMPGIYFLASKNHPLPDYWFVHIAIMMLSAMLLFIILRFVDDYDDLEADLPAHVSGNMEKAKAKKQFYLSLISFSLLLVLVLNFSQDLALKNIIVVLFFIYFAPFVFKKHYQERLMIGSFFYEGAPAAILFYGYCYWLDVSHLHEANWSLGISLALMYFIGYQFWKFSRKIGVNALQPYFIANPQLFQWLKGMLLASLLNTYYLFFYFSFSWFFVVYMTLVHFYFLLAVHFYPIRDWYLSEQFKSVTNYKQFVSGGLTHTAKQTSGSNYKPPYWGKMVFLYIVNVGVFVEIFCF